MTHRSDGGKATRTAQRWIVFALVLIAHGMLLWSWRFVSAPAPRQRGPIAEANVTVLQMIPAPLAAPAAQQARAPAALAAPAAPALRASRASALPPEAPQAITVHAAPEPALSMPTPEPSRLDLSVPRAAVATEQRTMRDQLLNDPRANSPNATVETRVAAVSGTTAMTEERMDDDKTRLRQNGACIEVHVSREAQTNPWNQNHSPTPKLVKPSC